MELRDYSDADAWLARAMESDPEVMKHLGGPTPPDKIENAHARRLRCTQEGSIWNFAIHPAPTTGAVGTIGIWESEWRGEKISEMGWMLLPAFHGRGYATEAGRLILERAREQKRWRVVHAFPAASNGPSNAICRKLGFTFIGEAEIGYNGPPQRSCDWKIELFPEQ
ncbi:MAG: GNAT family N-acetyltransferase [Elusimicrobia bacterium]|nr:GNAT family N-acetyltransferase [Elusimicrobiota bacterium]